MHFNELLDLATSDLATRVTTLARLSTDGIQAVCDELQSCLDDGVEAEGLAGLTRLALDELRMR